MKAFAGSRFAVVDVETTGTSHGLGDRVTDVAIVVVERRKIVDSFHSLVNPQRTIPSRIEALTGITNAMVARAPTFDRVARSVASFLKHRVFVAHNAPFDWGFLTMEFTRAGRPGVLTGTPLCTVRLARRLLSHLPRRNLDSVAHYYGVSIENRHRALGDARATAHVLLGLLRDVEKHDVEDVEQLLHWMSRPMPRRKRRSSLPTWIRDAGLDGGA